MISKKLYNYFLDWKKLFRPGSFKEFENISKNSIIDIIGTTVSWEKTLFLSELCRLSYIHDDSLRKKTLETVGLKEKCFYSNKGAEFYMLTNYNSNNKVKIICFVGTNDIFDYKNIFTYGSVNWNDKAKIYRGFKNSFGNIEKRMKKISYEVKNERIWLIGQSLGGVLAVLASFYFKNSELTVFGVPKIGDENFVNQLKKKKIYHFMLENDFINSLPFNNKKFKVMDSKKIPAKLSNNRTCPARLYAHSPINYSENIKLSRNNDIYK